MAPKHSRIGRGEGESELTVSKQEPGFEDFLIAEYEHIANAHFNTTESISNFFKHYLVIASLPLSAFALAFAADSSKFDGIQKLLRDHSLILPLGMSGIALVGFLILGYVINLRCDALLYARAVNGIRRRFYADAPLALREERRVRVLPRTVRLPRYSETRYFLFVVLTFASVGTMYVAIGWYQFLLPSPWIGLTAIALVTFAVHLALYWWLIDYREHGYLRGYRLGVDVDGVLNDHRTQFSRVLQNRTGKYISPGDITRIPVHELGLDVTEEDERAVFNWPEYWRGQPVIDSEAPYFLKKIKNLLGYRIWIFTHRPWPETNRFPAGHEAEYLAEWEKRWPFPFFELLSGLDRRREERGKASLLHATLIKRLTKEWLTRNKFEFDRLIVEKGNTHTPDSRAISRNRFVFAEAHGIRLFVEDDLVKAEKLADVCDVVFLIDQPYNQAPEVPRNVVRVRSWKEIYNYLRDQL